MNRWRSVLGAIVNCICRRTTEQFLMTWWMKRREKKKSFPNEFPYFCVSSRGFNEMIRWWPFGTGQKHIRSIQYTHMNPSKSLTFCTSTAATHSLSVQAVIARVCNKKKPLKITIATCQTTKIIENNHKTGRYRLMLWRMNPKIVCFEDFFPSSSSLLCLCH